MLGKERVDLVGQFDRGEVQVLTNCMVLTEGFDSQPVGCIVILRPMLHKGTFIQAVARGLRKVDFVALSGIVKTDCIVLDFTGAAQRHGSIEMDVRLDDEDAEPGAVPYKICPECRAELPLGTSPCPFCGHVWQREIGEKGLLEEFDLTEIDLLNRSPFRWCDLFGDDQSLIASGFDAWGGIFFDGEHRHAVGKPRQGRLCHLAIGTRPQVLSAADDFLRGIESTDAANKSRRWLKLSDLSDKQRQLLTRAGYSTASLDRPLQVRRQLPPELPLAS